MRATKEILRAIFDDIINKRKSFREAADWAGEVIRKDDLGEIELSDDEDISEVFSILTFLVGIDLEEEPGQYFYCIEDIKEKYKEYLE
ncbi:MAG: hypothetical protein L7U87_00115 [Chlamydiales bacterium]|nr:hypothetical protein [Chlamydiales bacterium]